MATAEPSYFREVLVLGQFVFGLSGSYTVFLMGVMCYVSDATAMTRECGGRAVRVLDAGVAARLQSIQKGSSAL